jgi:hypothetical protein
MTYIEMVEVPCTCYKPVRTYRPTYKITRRQANYTNYNWLKNLFTVELKPVEVEKVYIDRYTILY